MPKLHSFKFISDGRDSKVFIDDKEITGVTSIDFSAGVDYQNEVSIRLYVGESEIVDTITKEES